MHVPRVSFPNQTPFLIGLAGVAKVMITSVTTDGLDEKWVGRILGQSDVIELGELSVKHRFNVDGEGGEFETAVLDAPWMNAQINTQHTIHWTGRRGWVDIWGAELADV